MNISWKWLLQYVRYAGTRDEAVALLTGAGLNVDSVEELPDGDALFDVEVTSNRPDCLGHLGVARELAALSGAEFVLPETDYDEDAASVADLAVVEVADPVGCPRYTARVIAGVKIGPSPDWLVKRLEAVGLRPVNNVVDVTNFVLYEHGQPLHAFDCRHLSEHRIIVRRARPGEQFVAIDHSRHELKTRDLVIADARRAVALAGIMGGADTEVGDGTTDILLESAMFDALSVRTTSRDVQILSDSSYRFERGVDYDGVDWASRRACRLIVEVAGGRVARGVVDVSVPPPERKTSTFRLAQIPRVLGIDVPRDEVLRILRALGMTVSGETTDTLDVVPPRARRDLAREVDLVEEIARVHGYGRVPYLRHIPTEAPRPDRREIVTDLVQRTLMAGGCQEAITLTLTDAASAALFAQDDRTPPLETLGAGVTAPAAIRKSVLSGLLQAKRNNQDAGRMDVAFFEIARGFRDAGPDAMPHESVRLAILSDDGPDDARGVLDLVFDRLGLADRISFSPAARIAELDADGQADVSLDGHVIGFYGTLSAAVSQRMKFRHRPWVAEIEFAPLVASAVLTPRARPLAQFPAIQRDLALVVDEAVLWRDLVKAIRSAGVDELEDVAFVSLYRGEQIAAGKKCLALRLSFRSSYGTLTHEQADAFQQQILDAAGGRFAATLRAGA